jgi:hypothetical protein
MKKFAICCLALALAALFVPAAQAAPSATKCIHFTNFCDGFQRTQSHVGGVQVNEWVGLWDYVCAGNGTGSIMSGSVNKIGTHPTYPFDGGFAANFSFAPGTHLFDLYATFDGINVTVFQTAQPWTQTNGPCNPLNAQKNLPRSTVVQ